MKLSVAWIGKTKEPAIKTLTDEYVKRISRFAQIFSHELKDESAVLSLAGAARPERKRKDRNHLILLDSRGQQFSSEQLADFLDREQATAVPLLFAVGSSDGFTERARANAYLSLSLGKMTLPHELARVILLEQLYRAFTILNHHPYHLGH
jgi:23S rRNA (pseudouridine1915-N3)-methyltransferase